MGGNSTKPRTYQDVKDDLRWIFKRTVGVYGGEDKNFLISEIKRLGKLHMFFGPELHKQLTLEDLAALEFAEKRILNSNLHEDYMWKASTELINNIASNCIAKHRAEWNITE